MSKQIVYDPFVIKGFANKEAKLLFETGKSRRLPPDVIRRAARRLTQLDNATVIDDLREPNSNRLERLTGARKGQWNIRINDQWRLCFIFRQDDAYDAEICDYH